MSGPWLYSAVVQASARDTKPIQKIGTDPATSRQNQNNPTRLIRAEKRSEADVLFDADIDQPKFRNCS